QFRRCSGVASSSRGNQANGAASSRPSARTTMSRSSITVTSTAVASTLTVEVGIPCLQKRQTMLDHKRSEPVYLMSAIAMRLREADRLEPKLGDIVTVLNVDMRRLGSFHAVEEEAESGYPQNCWHRCILGAPYTTSADGFNAATDALATKDVGGFMKSAYP